MDYFSAQIKPELEKERIKMQQELWGGFSEVYKKLPEKGLPKQEVINKVRAYQDTDMSKVHLDKLSGALQCDSSHIDMVNEVISITLKCNNLHFTMYPNMVRMEIEIGKFLLDLLHGTEDARGVWCPGGSYSNITACQAAREHAQYERQIKKPEVIMCTNAHPSLYKGAKITKMKVVQIGTGKDQRIDVDKVLSSINSNTAMICLSAPSYPVGVIDNVEAIAAVCARKNIWLHVDGCLGSLVTPFIKENNFDLFSRFDLGVDGVCSISCDTHKQGLGPKGASWLLYKSQQHMRYGSQQTTKWEGGILPSVSLEGSKPTSIIAATWAVMMHMGRDGYKQNSFRIKEKVEKLKKEIAKIHPLYIQGSCDTMVVAFGCLSHKQSVYHIKDKLKELGWYIKDIQPPGIHVAVTNNNINNMDGLVSELKMIVATLDRMTPEELLKTGSGPGVQGMTNGFKNNLKLDMGMDLCFECMTDVGLVREREGSQKMLTMELGVHHKSMDEPQDSK